MEDRMGIPDSQTSPSDALACPSRQLADRQRPDTHGGPAPPVEGPLVHDRRRERSREARHGAQDRLLQRPVDLPTSRPAMMFGVARGPGRGSHPLGPSAEPVPAQELLHARRSQAHPTVGQVVDQLAGAQGRRATASASIASTWSGESRSASQAAGGSWAPAPPARSVGRGRPSGSRWCARRRRCGRPRSRWSGRPGPGPGGLSPVRWTRVVGFHAAQPIGAQHGMTGVSTRVPPQGPEPGRDRAADRRGRQGAWDLRPVDLQLAPPRPHRPGSRAGPDQQRKGPGPQAVDTAAAPVPAHLRWWAADATPAKPRVSQP
jgi:hypothetical protein